MIPQTRHWAVFSYTNTVLHHAAKSVWNVCIFIHPRVYKISKMHEICTSYFSLKYGFIIVHGYMWSSFANHFFIKLLLKNSSPTKWWKKKLFTSNNIIYSKFIVYVWKNNATWNTIFSNKISSNYGTTCRFCPLLSFHKGCIGILLGLLYITQTYRGLIQF